MTQLYVGNLSAEGDEKAIRALFGKYGQVREVLMKNGYAFVEFESPIAAEDAMRELNGTDILGHPMIVEPSHQQRLSSRYTRKGQCGKVEVTDIPPRLNIQGLEALLCHVGTVLKMEIDEGEFGVIKKVIVTYESQEQAQTAASVFAEPSEHTPKVALYDNVRNGTVRKGSPSMPSSPSKNSDFPLRVLVPSDMVGAIIGKDGATIRMITQLTRARVDVHRRENLGTAEKAITIIGPPECCTEACYQIMKIMQNELLMTSGMLDAGKFHEPLPVVPLKVLAHNELVGRVIGKGGNTLKRIMAESGTKITISKLKDLTTYNMERTITILGTIDNCKKAESLISAKLRASYESDMAQFIPEQNHVYSHQTLSPSPTNVPTPGGAPGMPPPPTTMTSDLGGPGRLPQAQSLPATPTATNVRTFLDYSGEHTRLTTLHGSTGALEVNNLGGFKLGPIAQTVANSNGNGGGVGGGPPGTNSGPVGGKLASAFESTIVDGMVKFNGSSASGGPPPPNSQMNGHAPSSTVGGLNGPLSGMGNPGLSSSANGHMILTASSSSNGLAPTNSLGLGAGGPSQENSHVSLSHSFSTGSMKPSTTSSAVVSVSQQHHNTASAFTTGNILNPPQSAGPLGGSHHGPRMMVGAAGGGGGGQGGTTAAGGGLGDFDDEISDVFHGLNFRDPLTAAPGYGRSRLRRSSAPVSGLPNVGAPGGSVNRSTSGSGIPNGYGLWGGFGGSDNHLPVLPDSDDSDEFPLPSHPQPQQQKQQQPSSAFATTNSSGGGTWGNSTVQSPANIWGGVVSAASGPGGPFQSSGSGGPGGPPQPPPPQAQGGPSVLMGPPLPNTQPPGPTHLQQAPPQGGAPLVGSRPNSQTSSYSGGSNSDQSGFSPIYSPTGASGFGGFSPINGGAGNIETCGGLLTTAPMFTLGEDREARSPFKASVPTPLTTVAESTYSNSGWTRPGVSDNEEDELFQSVTSATLEILGDGSQPTLIPPITTGGQW